MRVGTHIKSARERESKSDVLGGCPGGKMAGNPHSPVVGLTAILVVQTQKQHQIDGFKS